MHEELRCRILGGYGILCQEMGIALASWRDHTHCGEARPYPLASTSLSAYQGLPHCPQDPVRVWLAWTSMQLLTMPVFSQPWCVQPTPCTRAA